MKRYKSSLRSPVLPEFKSAPKVLILSSCFQVACTPVIGRDIIVCGYQWSAVTVNIGDEETQTKTSSINPSPPLDRSPDWHSIIMSCKDGMITSCKLPLNTKITGSYLIRAYASNPSGCVYSTSTNVRHIVKVKNLNTFLSLRTFQFASWLTPLEGKTYALAPSSSANMQNVIFLKSHPFTPSIPLEQTMRKNAKNCAVRALWAYNGTVSASKKMSILDLCISIGPQLKLVKNAVSGVSHCAVLCCFHTRVQSMLVYLFKPDKPKPTYPQPKEWFDRKLIIMVYDNVLCVQGHAIAIWPPCALAPETWSIRDPFRSDGGVAAIDRIGLSHVLAGAAYILHE